MKSNVGESMRKKMEELRLVCDTEIPIQHHKIDAAALSFKKSLDSTKAKTQQTLQFQEKLGKLKVELRELEDKLVKALAAKTRKEAKQIAVADSISATKDRVEELRGVVESQRTKKDEYAAIISQQTDELKACEEKHNQTAEQREEIEEAIAWYNKVLGLRIECGRGVKFILTNIDANNQDKEYFFTVRHENDVYTLIDCDPQLNDAKELLRELNKSNGLFKFVRTMREKFQAAVTHERFPDRASSDQVTSAIAMSAPVSSISTESRSEFSSQQQEHQFDEHNRNSRKLDRAKGGRTPERFPDTASRDQVTSTIAMSAPVSSISTESRSEFSSQQQELQFDEHNRNSRKLDRAKGGRAAVLSPGSASSLRRSPRFKEISGVQYLRFNNHCIY
ncbi:kinetochore protein SPC25 homolog isoform X2 [Lycium barbarum]|uniref:kinetochore protein SPC25 homolog isoform X2 n=1 Tax=Lycium barbarum TaxID=112863 RepID=UPI00293F6958|nr:kinetochore protein SPC25 homolog isoform X2 [Lycium barbarum]